MSETSDKEIIQGIVTEIMNARSAGSVTNTMVAQVLRYCVDTLGGRIEDLEGKDESEAIESLAEIAAFLAGITDSQTLSGILSGLRSDLHGEVVAESEARQAADTALDGRITTISEYLTQGYSYGGIASVSGTPGSGRKFYFAVAAGTYTNYGGLTVGNEIAVLKYDGTNWSKDVVFTIDNTPTAASVNPVKSGGVYDFVLGKTLEVVDVANLDTFKAADLRKSDNTQKYLLNYNGRNCGTLHIISDNAGHVVTQIITTHYLYDDSDGTIDWNGHSDNNVVQLYRSVKISGGTLPDDNWTRWNYVNNEILSLLKTDIDNVSSQLGYYRCNTAAATAAKTIDAPNYVLAVGGCIKIKFTNANTVASGVTLKIGSAAAMPLYYAGAAVSASNTWQDSETVEVYYDGTSYYANNVEGGGGFIGDETIIDISSIPNEVSNIYYESPNYKWQTNINDRQGKFIPITQNKKYRIVANSSFPTTYAILPDNTHVDGSTVVFASGCTRKNIEAGNEEIVNVPSNGHYIWVKTLNTGNDCTPQQIILSDKMSYEEAIENLSLEINGDDRELNIASATEYTMWPADNKWYNINTFAGRKIKMISIPPHYSQLKIVEPNLDVPNTLKASKLVFLKSATTPTNGSDIDFCEGETGIRDIAVGENVYDIPSDCVAIAIGTYIPTNIDKDITPSSVSISAEGILTQIQENSSSIEELMNAYGYTISKFETEKMAHVSNIDFANGYFYIPYTANEVNKVETYTDMNGFNRLAVVSLCNLSQPKWYDVAKAGQTIGDITMQAQLTPPYTTTIKIKGNYAYYIFRACVDGEVTFLCRRFVLATQEFENTLTVLTLDGDPFTTSKILSTYNSLSGAGVQSLESRGGDCNGAIILASDGYYYTGTGARGVNFYGLIYRSQDLLNWESVAAQNLNLGTYGCDEINVVQIESNKLLVSQRDSTNGIILRTYDITNNVWSDYKIIPNSLASRPWGFVYNGNCYVAVNVNGTNKTIAGYGTAIRQNLAIYKVDASLNIELIKTMHRDCSMQYPAFIVANENILWMSFTTDTRHLDTSGKSDIELKELRI